LALHDALPICPDRIPGARFDRASNHAPCRAHAGRWARSGHRPVAALSWSVDIRLAQERLAADPVADDVGRVEVLRVAGDVEQAVAACRGALPDPPAILVRLDR